MSASATVPMSMSRRVVATMAPAVRSRASLLSLSSASPREHQQMNCVHCRSLSTTSSTFSSPRSLLEKVNYLHNYNQGPGGPGRRKDGGGGGGTKLWSSRRFLWGWLNSIFNRVDPARIKEVGPDRACAEWLLRCGAGVKWDKAPDEWLTDYNSLPVGNYRTLKIIEINATDSAVMHIGFPHFEGLQHVKKAIFHRCMYLEDEGVNRIGYLKDTLEHLQISSCGNVSDEGILTLVQMTNLKTLKLYDFLEVRNRKNCLAVLRKSLPNCDIYFPFARESDRDPEAPVEPGKETQKS